MPIVLYSKMKYISILKYPEEIIKKQEFANINSHILLCGWVRKTMEFCGRNTRFGNVHRCP